MTISEALAVLEGCKWLKLSATHVAACNYKSRAEMSMLTRKQMDDPSCIYKASVLIRKSKGQTLEAMLIRAAKMIRAGHVPKIRRPPPKHTDRCACGANSHLAWNEQLKARVCRRCDGAWRRAALINDMPAAKGDVQ